MKTLIRNKKGVTLVELLAVLVILGIIAAIAVPTIGNLIDNSRERAAQAEFTNIQESARLYATAEEPDAAFSLSDMQAEGYMDTFDGTFLDEDDTDVSSEDIFDTDGELDISGLSFTEIYIDGYIVYPEPA